MTTPERITCPVCRETDEAASLEAEGFVVTAVEAFFTGDADAIKLAYDNATPDDFHSAVSLLAAILNDIPSFMPEFRPTKWLREVRKVINADLAGQGQAGTDTDSSDTDGAGS